MFIVQNCPNGLNVRSSPSVNGQKIGQLHNGATFTAQQIQGDWVFNGLGWSMMGDGNNKFVVPVSSGQSQIVPQVAPQMAPQLLESKTGTYTVQNCANGLNVRSGPMTTASLVGSALPNGTVVQVLNKNGVWFQHQQGWSMSAYGPTLFLVPTTNFVPTPSAAPVTASIPEGAKQELHIVVNANKGLNVRNGPGTEFQLVGAPLANGSQIVVIGNKGNWAQHLSGWSLSHDDHGTVFLKPVATSGEAHADGAGAEGQQSEGVVACEFCHAPFKGEDDVFCSKCGKSKTQGGGMYPAVQAAEEASPPAFNPNYS